MNATDRQHWQDVIIDHSQFPRGHRELDRHTHQGEGENPWCGDRVTVQLTVDENGVIREVGCQSIGCAISMASASLLADNLSGLTVEEAAELVQRVRDLVTLPDLPVEAGRGEIGALQMVRQYPSRVKCATLAWHALTHALGGNETTASTE
jgi:nitrogen fixation NifU-like protein